jgi:hypothetical protein
MHDMSTHRLAGSFCLLNPASTCVLWRLAGGVHRLLHRLMQPFQSTVSISAAAPVAAGHALCLLLLSLHLLSSPLTWSLYLALPCSGAPRGGGGLPGAPCQEGATGGGGPHWRHQHHIHPVPHKAQGIQPDPAGGWTPGWCPKCRLVHQGVNSIAMPAVACCVCCRLCISVTLF